MRNPLMRTFARTLALFALLLAGAASRSDALATLPPYFTDHVIAAGFDFPIPIVFLPDGRLLTAESKTGRIRMLVKGVIASTDPVATVDSLASDGGEQGLWGLAVDPRWPTHPYLYVMYGAQDSTLRIRRLRMSGSLSDSASGNLVEAPAFTRDILNDVPDHFGEHNGGCLRFGKDSLLYASFGDDYEACNATDPSELRGVIARMDVRKIPNIPGAPDKPLMVPASNPFASSGIVNERLVYARGFRNPFRFSIDRATGRLFVADVGLVQYEEIDVISTPGLNYGWPFLEGTAPYVTTESYTGAPLSPAVLRARVTGVTGGGARLNVPSLAVRISPASITSDRGSSGSVVKGAICRSLWTT